MHELSIAQNIVEIAEESAKNAKAKCIESITLEVGSQSGVILEALLFAMDEAKKGSMLENAELKVIEIKASAKCNNCSKIFETDDLYTPCPSCSHPYSDIISGKEMNIKSIDIN